MGGQWSLFPSSTTKAQFRSGQDVNRASVNSSHNNHASRSLTRLAQATAIQWYRPTLAILKQQNQEAGRHLFTLTRATYQYLFLLDEMALQWHWHIWSGYSPPSGLYPTASPPVDAIDALEVFATLILITDSLPITTRLDACLALFMWPEEESHTAQTQQSSLSQLTLDELMIIVSICLSGLSKVCQFQPPTMQQRLQIAMELYQQAQQLSIVATQSSGESSNHVPCIYVLRAIMEQSEFIRFLQPSVNEDVPGSEFQRKMQALSTKAISTLSTFPSHRPTLSRPNNFHQSALLGFMPPQPSPADRRRLEQQVAREQLMQQQQQMKGLGESFTASTIPTPPPVNVTAPLSKTLGGLTIGNLMFDGSYSQEYEPFFKTADSLPTPPPSLMQTTPIQPAPPVQSVLTPEPFDSNLGTLNNYHSYDPASMISSSPTPVGNYTPQSAPAQYYQSPASLSSPSFQTQHQQQFQPRVQNPALGMYPSALGQASSSTNYALPLNVAPNHSNGAIASLAFTPLHQSHRASSRSNSALIDSHDSYAHLEPNVQNGPSPYFENGLHHRYPPSAAASSLPTSTLVASPVMLSNPLPSPSVIMPPPASTTPHSINQPMVIPNTAPTLIRTSPSPGPNVPSVAVVVPPPPPTLVRPISFPRLPHGEVTSSIIAKGSSLPPTRATTPVISATTPPGTTEASTTHVPPPRITVPPTVVVQSPPSSVPPSPVVKTHHFTPLIKLSVASTTITSIPPSTTTLPETPSKKLRESSATMQKPHHRYESSLNDSIGSISSISSISTVGSVKEWMWDQYEVEGDSEETAASIAHPSMDLTFTDFNELLDALPELPRKTTERKLTATVHLPKIKEADHDSTPLDHVEPTPMSPPASLETHPSSQTDLVQAVQQIVSSPTIEPAPFESATSTSSTLAPSIHSTSNIGDCKEPELVADSTAPMVPSSSIPAPLIAQSNGSLNIEPSGNVNEPVVATLPSSAAILPPPSSNQSPSQTSPPSPSPLPATETKPFELHFADSRAVGEPTAVEPNSMDEFDLEVESFLSSIDSTNHDANSTSPDVNPSTNSLPLVPPTDEFAFPESDADDVLALLEMP